MTTISTIGLDIVFPFEPYGIQRAMMGRLAATLTNKEHFLLESPTGTGKTLVLLCSALAWQKKSKSISQPFLSERLKKQVANERIEKLKSRACSCENPNKKLCVSCEAVKVEEKFSEIIGDSNQGEERIISSKIKSKIPRIYYGTRTHKQISQVIRELNKTPYKEDLKMCILSSRDRTCIEESVRNSENKNDKCQELIKGKQETDSGRPSKSKKGSCPFYSDSNAIAAQFELINEEFKNEAWDIEDAADFGRRYRVCPYYGTRSLQEKADITFCPYNYLLDPSIRRALDINLNNAVVIFDEAHNIEDICRESASFSTDTLQIQEFVDDVNKAISGNFLMPGSNTYDAYIYFRNKIIDLSSYIRNYEFTPADKDSGDFINKKVFSQDDLLCQLENAGLGPNETSDFKKFLDIIKGDDDDSNDKSSKKSTDAQQASMPHYHLQKLMQLHMTLDFIFTSSKKNLTDFRLVIGETLNDVRRSKPLKPSEKRLWKFSIMCMNPGITFEKIHSSAWSVVVASGTLSPMESLKTELGCSFSNVFEGSHVINSERIFAAVMSTGPNNIELNAGFANSLKLDFQDEAGRILRDVCTTVPNGVLCFFPSYDRMDNLYQRWTHKGIMADISRTGKKLFREEKRKRPEEFEEDLREFNEYAAGPRGALLFAVFRGKVSEGIDFADKAARAVITIGIPYPNIKEVTIGLKKEYNDISRRQRPHLMTGGNWYAAQAFRALNQALGRCIRHKNDWGAIIMIDSRLNYGDNLKNISKWLRQVTITSKDYAVKKDQLESFVKRRLEEEES